MQIRVSLPVFPLPYNKDTKTYYNQTNYPAIFLIITIGACSKHAG